MPVYRFEFPPSNPIVNQEITPDIGPLADQSRLEENDEILYDQTNANSPEDVRSTLVMGFATMDNGVKQWLSDVRVPTGDGHRFMNVRIAGGDKTFLIWSQDFRTGRIKLPVCSINRGTVRFNEQKYSPPVHPIARRYNAEKTRVTKTFRPWPCLIDYDLSIWSERKRDAEYIIYQILTRMNPLAEFVVEDDYIRGNVQVRFGDYTDNSDIDIAGDERAKVRYDVNITIEGWLPLPEQTVPTVLGRVGEVKDFNLNSFLESLRFGGGSPISGT